MTPLRPYDLFVDSSGYFALLNRADPYHADASAVVRRASRNLRLVTSNLVVAEAHALFLGRLGRQAALDFLESVVSGSVKVERVTSGDEVAILELLRRYDDKSFSYTDASSFVLMRRLGIDIALTSDRDFIQAGFRQARA